MADGATRSARIAGAAVVLLLSLAACNGLLEVSDPAALPEGQLTDPSVEQFVVNGAIGEFQFAYTSYVMWSGLLADESFTDHTQASFRELSLHSFTDFNVTNEEVFVNLQRARQAADDAADRVKTMQGENAVSSLNVARALVYGGYSYVLLGEGFCEAPVNLSAGLSSAELLMRAIAHFDEGIAVATAAGKVAANAAAAADLLNMARVGAARASLKKGNLPEARAYAAGVPDSFERWAYYSANSVRENNLVQLGAKLGLPWLSIHPVFQGLGDPRIPQEATARTSLNSHPIFPPLKPSMYKGWTPTGPGSAIDVATPIRFASGLEARYIGVEADGRDAEMLAFVNARRASAGKPSLNLSGAALLSEFRMQRAIDFYLTGQRLGDLRRYAAAGSDLFPTGKFPIGADLYGTMHCFLVPLSEKSGNPNYRTP
jgi:hypothetical protein